MTLAMYQYMVMVTCRYATPWFLTLFAAHFPLGFVARVLDLVFLEARSGHV